MSAAGTTRTIRFSWMLVPAALAFGVLTAAGAEAKPNNGSNRLSISQRVGNAEDRCESLGGTIDHRGTNQLLSGAWIPAGSDNSEP